eukprot:TRINITY_DN3319_c0_g2_i1.p1 TRINITY_DN3319_c0_g2~~TRINITY_DN3319_c0_g2_i1.p1  ORF type:complete len:217 (-),score=27.99 TRINITY_DN3319_c0_g2_i1:23-673(-)
MDVEIHAEPDQDIGLRSRGRVCLVCKRQFSKYTCPRCNLSYCSLECYKQHGEGCTEIFYKTNAIESLKSQHTSQADKKKMLNIIKKNNQEDSEEKDEDEEELQNFQNLLKLADQDEISIGQLTESQKNDFKHFLQDPNLIGSIIPLWTPFWDIKKFHIHENKIFPSLICDLTQKCTDSQIPELPTNIPPLTDILKTKASDSIRFNLIDLVLSLIHI